MKLIPTSIPGAQQIEIPFVSEAMGAVHVAWSPKLASQTGVAEGKSPHLLNHELWHGAIRGVNVYDFDHVLFVGHGTFRAVVVDLRSNQPTCLEHDVLDLRPIRALLVPAGCGIGMQALFNRVSYVTVSEKKMRKASFVIDPHDESLKIKWEKFGFHDRKSTDQPSISLKEFQSKVHAKGLSGGTKAS